MKSIYNSEINQIIYNLGHRENFLNSSTEAIDTLFYNYLHSEPTVFFEYESTIKQFAAIQIQDFYNNYILRQLKYGASDEWGKNVLWATYTCLNKIAKKDECIEMLKSTFEELILN